MKSNQFYILFWCLHIEVSKRLADPEEAPSHRHGTKLIGYNLSIELVNIYQEWAYAVSGNRISESFCIWPNKADQPISSTYILFYK